MKGRVVRLTMKGHRYAIYSDFTELQLRKRFFLDILNHFILVRIKISLNILIINIRLFKREIKTMQDLIVKALEN